MDIWVQVLAVIVFVVGIGGAGFVLLRGMVRRRTLKRLEQIGVPTQARVVEVRDHRLVFGLQVGVGEDESRSYFVVYAYDALGKDGTVRRYSREEAINEAWYHRLAPDDPIPIHYLRSRPELARIDGNRWYGDVCERG